MKCYFDLMVCMFSSRLIRKLRVPFISLSLSFDRIFKFKLVYFVCVCVWNERFVQVELVFLCVIHRVYCVIVGRMMCCDTL